MHFPVYIFGIHPHLLFESLSYFIGFRVYLYTRNKNRIPMDKAMWVIVGAIFGAVLGSKLVYWFEDPVKTMHLWNNLTYMMEGKTIVGGLLGGLIGVETAKKIIGWKNSTGDDFVLPLAVGMMIGRIGCFLTGLDDHTYGIATNWFTGIDFGDGVRRHPTQIYEIVFLLLLIIILITIKKKQLVLWEGYLFQLFMLSYLAFRLMIDFIKPTPHPYFHLNNIQLACIIGIIYYIQLLVKKSTIINKGMENQHAK
ncbi:diacylglyceryl transferase [Heyndrickxia shackletonii]|uniref:Diacylglyceryl transferase n=1 Tax=Heyndrickxia shackletonii TaxID=157838 RepID=A0A0Q3TIZ4_9BACI|nr:prolipoprotein diacylglyceryl transferase family protein [Heyndrickxia shackletonii]KQL53912.1 diacylglyceryl transferase [Heyndrickxia shackletonii]MBB2478926.1 prolipoprotein diacylglyceryl transferase [Bacillus sp. APMAM]NEY97809.1 prolipoprotein diacylglyceryl transferase [Heyndrickxia shackletonii]RTZ57670.1 diacylglyceryl transferase [Bacillus sp. SAJ1]